MTTIEAVYTGGVFRPAVPPALPDGAAVRLAIVPEPSTTLNPADVLARIRAIAAIQEDAPPVDDGVVVSENVDRILYGRPRGAP